MSAKGGGKYERNEEFATGAIHVVSRRISSETRPLSLSDDFRGKVMIRVRNEIVNCCEATLKLKRADEMDWKYFVEVSLSRMDGEENRKMVKDEFCNFVYAKSLYFKKLLN